MRELLFGGLLYLAGVVIVLIIKPRLMFTEEGNWKEFGIGRNARTHSWMPFWLFCILWALLSYALISVLVRTISANEFNNIPAEDVSLLNNRGRNGLRAAMAIPPATNNRNRSAYGDFEPGYYVLNRAASRRKGVPHYKYYGPEMMEML